jgi:hypothetical protein
MRILPDDHVIAGHGELVHRRCSPDATDLGHRLGTFLGERDDHRFCQSCLVSMLGVTYEDIRRAVALLRTMRRVLVAVDTCWQCRASRVTVQIRDAQSRSGQADVLGTGTS